MFITLTNQADGFEGEPVLINADIIATVREERRKELPQKTYVFCPPHGTWEVRESIEEISKLLNQ